MSKSLYTEAVVFFCLINNFVFLFFFGQIFWFYKVHIYNFTLESKTVLPSSWGAE